MQNQEWTKLSDRKPKTLEPVQVAFKKADGNTYVREGFVHASGKWSISGWYNPETDVVTHWKPLSEPPKEQAGVEAVEQMSAEVTPEEIKKAAKSAKVPLWKVAEKLKMQDSALSRRMRHSFSKKEAEKVFCAIKEIAEEQASA